MSTISAGQQQTLTIQEGQALNIIGAVGAAGAAYLLDPVLGGTNSTQSWAVGAGALAPIGLYVGQQRVLIVCMVGSIDADVRDASLGLTSGSPVLPAASSTNRGGTVASANVSQVLMPANAARAGIVFQNNSPWPIGLNLTGGVAACGSGSVSAPGAGIGSLFIAPGRTFTSDALAVSASQITVACQRGTAAFGCTEYTAASGQSFAKTVTDRSGTITYGGVSQALFAANTSRKGFIFQNLSKFPMFVQEVVSGALTGSSRKVLPYEILGANDFGVSTSAFSVICRGAGNGFTALEY